MQDDMYMIALDGWKANSDLSPPQLIIDRYFAAEQLAIVKLEADRDAIASQREELDEEHNAEGGLSKGPPTTRAKINRVSIKTRLKDIMTDPDAQAERMLFNRVSWPD